MNNRRVVTTDVDIDVFDRDKILQNLDCIYGRIDRENGVFDKHLTGVYFQNMPKDPSTDVAVVDHRIAGDYGFFKIDFLNVNFYKDIKNEEHLLELMNREPPWDFFLFQDVTDQLFHLKGHSNLLRKFPPSCVEDLAIILALIRPSKAHLQNQTWESITTNIWVKDESDGYFFKRSHAVGYALAIVVHLNLLIEEMTD